MNSFNATSPSTNRYTPSRVLKGIQARLRVLMQGLMYVSSRTIYGNFAGFRNNFFPRHDLARYRVQSGVDRSQIAATHCSAADHLRDRGYFLLKPSRYSETTLKSIINKYNVFIEDDAHSVRSPNGASRFLYRPLERIPELPEFLSEELEKILKAYYGCPFRVQSVRAWRNYHVPGVDANNDVFSNTFHNDGYSVTGLRLFVLLCDDVSRDTGAFRFHDKLTSRRITRSIGFFHRNLMSKGTRRRLVDPSTLRFFEGDAGDACLCNTQECLHGASVPKQGIFRDVVQFEIEPCLGPMENRLAAFRHMPEDEQIEEMRRRR